MFAVLKRHAHELRGELMTASSVIDQDKYQDKDKDKYQHKDKDKDKDKEKARARAQG